MEKINITELLKDCPKGMELDCASYDNVSFDKISDDKKATYPIFCYITDKEGNRSSISFTKNGCESKRYGAKCVIFPKGKTTWKGFHRPFKDGDIVTYEYENGLVSMILKKFVNFVEIHHHCALYDNAKGFVTNNYIVGELKYIHLATEEEKQKLFDAIEMNGYKWNAETKTLEKLVEPKFRVGDRIKHKEKTKWVCTIARVKDIYYVDGHPMCFTLPFGKQDDYELVPNKFDINTLKPFDKVLARHRKDNNWTATFFSHTDEKLECHCYKFVTSNGSYPCVIPYEGNEHLLGTTNDCDDFYKTWEK